GSGDGEIRRIDLGVNVLAGYELKNGLFFSANYTRGLTNWLNVSTDTWRNNLLGVSVGYFFGKKK
ncbi:MAG: PorT family protein, partial [Chitinophagaceae bacterium]